MRPLLLVVFSGVLCACGGGVLPIAPDAATAKPSASASVSGPRAVNGVTGAAIDAVFTPPQPARNELATVRAAGYLVREQLYTGEPVRLWPATDESRVRQLVYVEGATGGEIRLRRWESPGLVVALPPEIAASASARAAFERAVADASRITGLSIGLGSDGPVRVVFGSQSFADDPDPACAFARTWLRGAVITQAEVVYRSVDTALGRTTGCDRESVAAHELGHVLGLQHVNDPGALMNPVLLQARYSEWEEQSLQVMYRCRRAGNGPPDREAGVAPADARVRVDTIVD